MLDGLLHGIYWGFYIGGWVAGVLIGVGLSMFSIVVISEVCSNIMDWFNKPKKS